MPKKKGKERRSLFCSASDKIFHVSRRGSVEQVPKKKKKRPRNSFVRLGVGIFLLGKKRKKKKKVERAARFLQSLMRRRRSSQADQLMTSNLLVN